MLSQEFPNFCQTVSLIELPIDTFAEVLDQEVRRENVRKLVGRILDGWEFDLKRDDASKTHPCLEPYSDLTDSEKNMTASHR